MAVTAPVSAAPKRTIRAFPAPPKEEISSSMPEEAAPAVQITSFLGLHALEGQNVALGFRLGVRYPKKKDLFIGPEVALAPPGRSSSVYIHLTIEQQFNLARDGRISGGLLVYGGVAFPQGVPAVGLRVLSAGGEFFVARRVDELARIRFFARAGLVAEKLTATGGLAVAFRL